MPVLSVLLLLLLPVWQQALFPPKQTERGMTEVRYCGRAVTAPCLDGQLDLT